MEETEPQRPLDLIFGLTEGWWRFHDTALRPTYPLLSASTWEEVLREAGFQACTAIRAESEGASFGPAVVLATRPHGLVAGAVRRPEHWLVLADSLGIGDELAASLRAHHDTCTVVRRADEYRRLSDEAFEIAPTRREDFARLFREAGGLDRPPVSRVVHLWGVDVPIDEAQGARCLAAAFEIGCLSALHVLQAAIEGADAISRELVIVTRGAQPVGPDPQVPGLAQSTLWGMGRVIALEHPELRCVRIDLDPDTPSERSRPVFDELWSGIPHEDQLAFRRGARYVARLVRSKGETTSSADEPAPAREAALAAVHFPADRTCLITGGLGGLGLVVARWLVDRGARHLALVGRHGPTAAAREALANLETAGARVLVLEADVADWDALAGALTHVAESLPPIAAIFHAAGVLDDAMLRDQRADRFARVLRPKVDGAWNLHCLTRSLPIEQFVLFSSAAALLGSPGQANHAAANAFLDVLASWRRARGLPALSIGWGLWSDVGAAADRRAGDRMASAGIGAITPEEGVMALEQALAHSTPYVGIVPVVWPRLLARVGPSRFLSEVAGGAVAESADGSSWTSRWEAASADERRGLLVTVVRAEVARVLGTDPAAIDPEQGFFEIGMDSLTSVELRNRLESQVGCSLSSTVAFDHPTVTALADHLASRAPTSPVLPPSGVAPAGRPANQNRHTNPQQHARRERTAPDEAIAVIGLSCRFPRGNSPEAYWQSLQDGVDAVTVVPSDRWDLARYYDPDRDAVGKMYMKYGAFLDRSTSSTPASSGSRRARRWEWIRSSACCSKSAGRRSRTPATVQRSCGGSHTGVFVGVIDAATTAGCRCDADRIDMHTATGNGACILAGRSPTSSISAGRAWPSIRRAPRRSSPSTSRARACGRRMRRSRSPVAST